MNWQNISKHVLAIGIVCAALYMAVTGSPLPDWLVAGIGVVLGVYFPNSMMLFRIQEVNWQDVTKYVLAAAIVGCALYMAATGAVLPDWLLASVGAVLGTFYTPVTSAIGNALVWLDCR